MRLREFDEKERLEKANEKLNHYKTAAGADAAAADAEGNFARGNTRFKGINRATKKQFANDAKLSQLKELEINESTDPKRAKLERMIWKYFGQIYDYGDDDGLNYLDRNGELWNQLMDKYDGEIEDIVAGEPIEVLMQAAQELKGIAGDMKYELDEQGVAEGSLEEIDRRGFLKGIGAAAVAGAAGGAKADQSGRIAGLRAKLAREVGVLDVDTKNYDRVGGSPKLFLFANDGSNFVMQWIDKEGNDLGDPIFFGGGRQSTDNQGNQITMFFGPKIAVKIMPGSDTDRIYITPRSWIENKIGWQSVYAEMPNIFSMMKRESVEQGVAEGLTEMDKSEPSAGRDGGPRPGPDKVAKPISAKKATKDMRDMLNRAVKDAYKKKDVKEDQLDELSKDTLRDYMRAQPARIKGPAGLATTNPKKAARIVNPEKGDMRRALTKLKDPAYGQQGVAEDSLAAMRRLAGIVTPTPAVVSNGPRQYRHMPTAVQPR
jgi:hypothetical protein